VFYGDGGGKAAAAAHPVLGRDRVARLMLGLFAKGKALGIQLRHVEVNGQPGAMLLDAEARLISVLALDAADGAIQSIRVVVNPDKLRHLGTLSDLGRLPDPRHD
jgi:hypothetical protein